jgi:hypothetical protein
MTNPNVQKLAKDLTKQAPRLPTVRIGGLAQLARCVDKCRAALIDKNGEYHYDCPVDKMMFGFLGINGDQLKAQVQAGKTDEEMYKWIQTTTKKTEAEMKTWSDGFEKYIPDAKQDWFTAEAKRLGFDAKKTPLVKYLELDDKATFKA